MYVYQLSSTVFNSRFKLDATHLIRLSLTCNPYCLHIAAHRHNSVHNSASQFEVCHHLQLPIQQGGGGCTQSNPTVPALLPHTLYQSRHVHLHPITLADNCIMLSATYPLPHPHSSPYHHSITHLHTFTHTVPSPTPPHFPPHHGSHNTPLVAATSPVKLPLAIPRHGTRATTPTQSATPSAPSPPTSTTSTSLLVVTVLGLFCTNFAPISKPAWRWTTSTARATGSRSESLSLLYPVGVAADRRVNLICTHNNEENAQMNSQYCTPVCHLFFIRECTQSYNSGGGLVRLVTADLCSRQGCRCIAIDRCQSS